jgi:ribonuclease-3
VLRLLGDRIEVGAEGPGEHDFKTRLQEYVAREFDQLPRYQVRAEGPDHAKRFFAMVTIRGAVYGHGQGRSKKQAEQAAARAAWRALTRDAGAA